MSKNEKLIKRGKILILVFALLSLFNIIILINNKSYALFRKTVSSKRVIEIHTASEFPFREGLATEVIKRSLGKTGGIIGVTNDNQKVTEETSNIREYRYSGLGVNNYVTFNNELWRIIGVFKDEKEKEHIKIVRNEVLKYEDMPDDYAAAGKTFNIRYPDSSFNTAYWNYDGISWNSNWADAGLMYWLNSTGSTNGYLNTLTSKAQNMIENSKWYLGVVTHNGDDPGYIKDTPIEAYKYERAVTGCNENKGSITNNSQSVVEENSSCRVWANNAATWQGKIALMYLSDYGFSASDSYWTTKLGYGIFNESASDSSWLQKEANHTGSEWFLSTSSRAPDCVAHWDGVSDWTRNYFEIRPTLYLKSNTQIIGGNGSSEKPYQLDYSTAVEKVKRTLGINGGVIGVTTNNEPTTDKEVSDIREYRYSGLGVNNYVTFNDETWRIIGVFKDDTEQEHVKIVRNELIEEADFPITYTANGKTFDIRYSGENWAYWNVDPGYNNNWAESGLMYWLNSLGTTKGYLENLSSIAQNMIAESTWYLGNVRHNADSDSDIDTTIQLYEHERGNKSCVPVASSVGDQCAGGDIWSGREATWTGNIALMYLSDMGFSTDSNYWNNSVGWMDSAQVNSTWLKESHLDSEWFISPSSYSPYHSIIWYAEGHVNNSHGYPYSGVRPSLYLKSEVHIISGNGTKKEPYQLSVE